jgi:N-acetylmuramoyl-L-alanine amidase
LGSITASAQTERFNTVVIDAGHGGHDRGGIPGQRVAESVVTLDVAQRLRRNLERAGYRTIMTRNSDVFVPLSQRVAIANSYRDAIFVAVHFNSAGRAGANGIETYFYSGESSPLAASIHRNVLAGAPSENRGVRRRGYFVLRRTTIPAVLVECGFLTNPTEASLAQTSAYRQKLADKIARGIQSQPRLARRTSSSSRVATARSSGRGSVYRVDSSGTTYMDMTAAVDRHLRKPKRSGKKSAHHTSSSKKKTSSGSKKKTTRTKKKST